MMPNHLEVITHTGEIRARNHLCKVITIYAIIHVISISQRSPNLESKGKGVATEEEDSRDVTSTQESKIWDKFLNQRIVTLNQRWPVPAHTSPKSGTNS